ncbi:MAG: HAMP domain-containing sensor histidine kinase [Bacillota bacterium]|nr:HAMP domain-containing sensor histidine kinase [Bacillota bacterium]
MRKWGGLQRTKSLQWKLLSRFFLILMLLLLIMEAYQYMSMKQNLYKSREQVLETRFHNVEGPMVDQIQTEEELKAKANSFVEDMVDINISAAVIDKNGNRAAGASKSGNELKRDSEDNHTNLLSINNQGPGKPMPAIPIPKLSQEEYKQLLHRDGNLEGYTIVRDENNSLQVVIFRKIGDIHSPSGLIQLTTSAEPVNSMLLQQLYIFIGASILVLIIGGILGATVFKYTLKPLHNVTDTVEKINVEQLNTRLNVETGQLEIDKLSNAFNKMLGRIEDSFEQEQYIKEKMRQFISDASHELRTPLTSIHGFVEVLLRGAAKNEKQLDLALNSILMESERLAKLVNDLLLLTRLDQKLPIEVQVENLKDIIEEVYPQLQILAGERKIELHLDDKIIIKANRNQIKQVIYNLVQNSIRHTDEKEGIVAISTSIVDKFAVLKVTDNGTGIPKEHLTEIFDRFFRSETHRSRKHGGYGLGLSIVKSIVDAHDGTIEVQSEVGDGTTFAVYLSTNNNQS